MPVWQTFNTVTGDWRPPATSRRRSLWLTVGLAAYLLVRSPGLLVAPAAARDADIQPRPSQFYPQLVTIANAFQPDELWSDVRYQIGRFGRVNRLQDSILQIATEVFGMPAKLTGTDYGVEYLHEADHREGCALDTMLPRLPRAETEAASKRLAGRLVAELDWRTRVVVFMDHRLRRVAGSGKTDHIHIAVRCRALFGYAEREKFGSEAAWRADLLATSWSWNGE